MYTGHCIHVHWALYSCPLGTVFMSTGTAFMSTRHCIHVYWHCIHVHWALYSCPLGTVFMSTGTVFLCTGTAYSWPLALYLCPLALYFWNPWIYGHHAVCSGDLSARYQLGVILPGTWFLVSQAFTIIKKGSPVNFFAPLKAILIWNLKRTVSWEFPDPIFFRKQGPTETTIFTFVLSFKMMFNFKFFRWAEVFELLIQTPLLNEGPSLHSLIKNTVV